MILLSVLLSFFIAKDDDSMKKFGISDHVKSLIEWVMTIIVVVLSALEGVLFKVSVTFSKKEDHDKVLQFKRLMSDDNEKVKMISVGDGRQRTASYIEKETTVDGLIKLENPTAYRQKDVVVEMDGGLKKVKRYIKVNNDEMLVPEKVKGTKEGNRKTVETHLVRKLVDTNVELLKRVDGLTDIVETTRAEVKKQKDDSQGRTVQQGIYPIMPGASAPFGPPPPIYEGDPIIVNG